MQFVRKCNRSDFLVPAMRHLPKSVSFANASANASANAFGKRLFLSGKSGIVFMAALLFICFFQAAPADEALKPSVDERVELVGIVFRLAGAQEYQARDLKHYNKAIESHFGPFKKHPAIQAAKGLRRYGIGHDAVISYAIHLSIVDGSLVFPGVGLTTEEIDERWNEQRLKIFSKALDDFYVESRFHEFFEAHREMYDMAAERCQKVLKDFDFGWYEKFYGRPGGSFHLILNMIDEKGGYGPKCRFQDGREEFYAVLGAFNGADAQGIPVYRAESSLAIVVHEFNHSFCNPLIEKHMDELKPAAERLFPFVQKKMKRQAYGNASTMLYEYLVRACEIKYMQDHGKQREADRYLRVNRENGFLWLGELVEALQRYDRQRDKYPTLEIFMPKIVMLQDSVVTDGYIEKLRNAEAKKPKIVSVEPANGATDVDPATTEIRVTFDRQMGKGFSWCTADGYRTYPPMQEDAGPPYWTKDGKTCVRDKLALEPNTTYNLWFNSERFQAFRSDEGVPLEPVSYTFTTGDRR